jgi:thiosulfate/3-mercaptopyruvate sulfurtransferase
MRKLALLLAVLLLCGTIFGCATQTASTEATAADAATKVAFTGKYIVDAQYVLDNLENTNVLLVDARGEDAAKAGTVQGAIAVTWQLFASVGDGAAGDAMWGTILDTERLSAALSETGIAPDREIILFADAQKGWGADGRILWELVAAGFPNVKMVNGGYDALVAAGVPTTTEVTAFTPADVVITAIDATHVINTDALVADYESYKVVDVRAQKEYDGAVDYGEAKGGHLPGAVLVAFTDLFREDGTLKSNDEITALFEAAGVAKTDTVVTYCTKGIRSAYAQLILEMCGFENTLNYDESYYRWAASQEVEQ